VSSDRPHRDQHATTSVAPAGTPSTVDFLAGDWTLVRRIRDHRTGQAGSFQGTASLRPCPESDGGDALEYVESGELRFGSHRGPAARSLRVQDAGDGTADVRFADGREFYHLDLRAGPWAATHPCRADLYLVTVTPLSPDSYAENWRVTGPAKDYELLSTYTRTGSGGPNSAAGPGGQL